MALPSTITLNVGSPAANVVFGDRSVRDNETVYFAPSPNSDLAGRIKLRLSHEVTKTGIARSLVQFVYPILNVSTGKYDSSITCNATITRSETASLADVDEVMEMLQEVFAVTDFRTDIGKLLN